MKREIMIRLQDQILRVFFIFFHPKAHHICYNNSNIVKF